MSIQPSQSQGSPSADEAEVRTLYRQLIDAWNQRNAGGFAALFTEDAHVTGFDGSQMNGQAEIASELSGIFAHHVTALYISKVRGVQLLRPEVAVLHAVVGMVPPGQSDLNPALNAIQSLVAVRSNGTWRIVLFQTTPAQFHGRPELVEQLTEELRQLLP